MNCSYEKYEFWCQKRRKLMDSGDFCGIQEIFTRFWPDFSDFEDFSMNLQNLKINTTLEFLFRKKGKNRSDFVNFHQGYGARILTSHTLRGT